MDGAGAVEARTTAPSMVSEGNDTASARAEMHIEPSVIEGRQRIVIKHFSLLKNEVTEEFDSPEKFTLCGEEFNLRLYPGGFNDESRNYLGFYLKSHGNKQLWLAKSDYRIVNQKARPQMASADDDGGGAGIAARTLPDEVSPSRQRRLVSMRSLEHQRLSLTLRSCVLLASMPAGESVRLTCTSCTRQAVRIFDVHSPRQTPERGKRPLRQRYSNIRDGVDGHQLVADDFRRRWRRRCRC
jgi:hypothetical protein